MPNKLLFKYAEGIPVRLKSLFYNFYLIMLFIDNLNCFVHLITQLLNCIFILLFTPVDSLLELLLILIHQGHRKL